jgi:hypothetical protein
VIGINTSSAEHGFVGGSVGGPVYFGFAITSVNNASRKNIRLINNIPLETKEYSK